jgi:hypothetical protein
LTFSPIEAELDQVANASLGGFLPKRDDHEYEHTDGDEHEDDCEE